MKVKEIVSKREKVTYKEVAESLVDELELKPEENENVLYFIFIYSTDFYQFLVKR